MSLQRFFRKSWYDGFLEVLIFRQVPCQEMWVTLAFANFVTKLKFDKMYNIILSAARYYFDVQRGWQLK